jgi:hypothetical protein
MNEIEEKEDRWLDRPGTVGKIIWGLGLLSVLLVLSEFFFDRHAHYSWEAIPGFNAFFGFVSCVLLVLAAKVLRKILMRDEDYYD